MTFRQYYADLLGGFGNNSASPPDPERQAQIEGLPEGPDKELLQASTPPGPVEPRETPDLSTFPGLPGSEEAGNDDAEAAYLENMALGVGAPLIPNPRNTQGPTVMPEGSNYLPFGGERGKELFDETFVKRPQEIENAINAGAQAEEDKGKLVADWYQKQQYQQQQEAMALQGRRQRNQAEIQAKQQQLEEATTRYSNDLSDRGQYWRNPGNIIASIGAALMTLGSDDHAIGYKLINQAAQHDWNQRKQLADTNLGELKSNLSAYRQIAGDAELGDKLSMAENARIAAMELERIGAQFQGPIAKAKAKAISENFRADYNRIMAQVNASMVYNKAHMENPAIAKAVQATGKALPGVGYSPYGDYGKHANEPVKAYGGQTTRQVNETAKAVAEGKEVLSDKNAYDLDKRSPGASKRLMAARFEGVPEVLAEIGANPYGVNPSMTDEQIASALTPAERKEFNKKMVAYRKDQASDYKDISAKVTPVADRIAGYRQLGQDIEIIEQTANKLGKHPDELTGNSYDQVFGSGNMKKLNEFLGSGAKEGEHAQQAQRVKDAVDRFKQLKMARINQYFKGTSGAAVSEQEKERLDQFISGGARWSSVRNFSEAISKEAQAQMNAATSGAKYGLTRAIWDIRTGMSTPRLNQAGIDKPTPPDKRHEHIQGAIKALKGR